MQPRFIARSVSLLPTALAWLSVLASPEAFAVVLDFEDLRCARNQPVCDAGNVYSAKGYALRYTAAPDDDKPVGFHAVGKLWPPNASGTIALLANSCNASTTLTATSRKTFSVLAMDLAEANGDSPSNVEFIGTKSDGSHVQWTAYLDGKPGWQRVVLPSTFYNLSALTWLQGDCVRNRSHMFDNLFIMPGIGPR